MERGAAGADVASSQVAPFACNMSVTSTLTYEVTQLTTPSRNECIERRDSTPVSVAFNNLDRAHRRVSSMKARLAGVSTSDDQYRQILTRLHLFERVAFNRQLELDELLREQRQLRRAGYHSPQD